MYSLAIIIYYYYQITPIYLQIFLINGLLIATDEVHNEEIFNDYNITGAHNLNNQYKIQSSSGRYGKKFQLGVVNLMDVQNLRI